MNEFKPFANDSQVLTFPTGSDELTVENGREAIVLAGTLTISRADPGSREAVRALCALLQAIQTAS